MKAIALFDAKNKMSEVCDRVARTKEPVVITRRGRALVRIMPLEDAPAGSDVWHAFKETRATYGEPEVEFELPERTLGGGRPDPLDESDSA